MLVTRARNYDNKVVKSEIKLNAPVQVPADFAGFHLHRWPVSVDSRPVSPDASHVHYKSRRLHDAGCAWYLLNTAYQQYNFDHMDALVADNEAIGATTWFTLYGTPSWALLHPEDANTRDLYNWPGGAGAARHDLLELFVRELLAHYNSGEARIKYFELWNEPQFNGKGSGDVGDGFYWGTAEELVDMCKFLYDLIKSIDPRVEVVSPGFNHMTNLREFANTISTTTGTKGVDTCDTWAFHPYGAVPFPGPNYIVGTNKIVAIDTFNRILRSAGAVDPVLHMSECGIYGHIDAFNEGIPAVTSVLDTSPEYRKTWLSRLMILAAIHGVKSWYAYSYESGLSGDFQTDLDGMVAGFNRIADTICGKTIERAWLYSDNSVEVQIDGVLHHF